MRLEIENLAFGYPGRLVGHGVSLLVEAGDVVCLLGPNGGGKTTLFKTILRLIEPRGGRVAVNGKGIGGWSRRRLARLFGYVPQAAPGTFPFTIREIVLMGRTAHIGLFATPSARDVRVADETLTLLGLAHLAERPYPEVSGGERQMALIARALAQEPRVLVMDEPTANLDFGNQVRVLSRIRGLADGGLAVILSTHDPDQAFLCADHVAMLREGRLVCLGPPEEAITTESLRLVYGVDVDVMALDRDGRSPTRVCVPAVPRHSP